MFVTEEINERDNENVKLHATHWSAVLKNWEKHVFVMQFLWGKLLFCNKIRNLV